MSTKLNATELAAKRYPNSINIKLWEPSDIYATAIREVAQPIADERDAFLKSVNDLLDIIHDDLTHARQADHHEALSAARAVLAKYPKP